MRSRFPSNDINSIQLFNLKKNKNAKDYMLRITSENQNAHLFCC